MTSNLVNHYHARSKSSRHATREIVECHWICNKPVNLKKGLLDEQVDSVLAELCRVLDAGRRVCLLVLPGLMGRKLSARTRSDSERGSSCALRLFHQPAIVIVKMRGELAVEFVKSRHVCGFGKPFFSARRRLLRALSGRGRGEPEHEMKCRVCQSRHDVNSHRIAHWQGDVQTTTPRRD